MSRRDRPTRPLAMGYHIKTAPSVYAGIARVDALYRGHGLSPGQYKIAVQIFTKAPRQFASSILERRDDLNEVRYFLKDEDIFLVIHGIYLVNFINYDESERARKSIIEDLRILEKISPQPSASGVVVHLGYNTRGKSIGECISDFVRNLITCLDAAPGKGRLLLETSVRSKNGRDLFHDLDNLAALYQSIPSSYKKRIGFCVDSCHVYSSGFDVSSEAGFDDFMAQWERKIGTKHIMLFHLNDSKLGVGSNRDLHQEIGLGTMFKRKDGLRAILRWCGAACVPVVLETGGKMDREFPKLLRVVDEL